MEKATRSEALERMKERFGQDSLISLATLDGTRPAVRTVNSYYEDGSFYVITHGLSSKIQQISVDPAVAICGEWFTAHGVGENLGYIRDGKNKRIAEKLRAGFASWYSNGHTDENDINTCILRIRLTDGILYYHGTRYDIDFCNILSD